MSSAIPPILVVRDVLREIARLPIGEEPVVVGRTAQAEIMLDHAAVSRRHAEFWRDSDGRCHVRDLQSRNGTLVDGVAISEYALVGGEQIRIGPFVLTIVGTEPTKGATRIVVSDELGGRFNTLNDFAPPRIDVSHLMALNEFSAALLATAEAGQRSQMLCRLMVGQQFRGRWALVVRTALGVIETPPVLLCEAQGGSSAREPYLSRGMLRKVRETGEAVLASNSGLPDPQAGDVNISISPAVMAMAAVACPIARSAEWIDLLYVILPPALGSAEWLALVNLAVKQFQQADTVWAARRQAETLIAIEQDLAQARKIQLGLVPENPRFDGLDVAIGFIPCGWIGGDYADTVKMKDGRILLVVADVCGKGLPAALIASSVHTMIHAGVLGGLGLAEMISNLNRYLLDRLSGNSFVTLIAIAINPATGATEMIKAGHPPMLIYSPTGGIREIDDVSGNPPLGVLEDPIPSHHLKIEADEILLLYSDGVSELQGKTSMLGVDGVKAEFGALCASGWSSARDAVAQLSRRLDAIQEERPAADDRTFLLARRKD